MPHAARRYRPRGVHSSAASATGAAGDATPASAALPDPLFDAPPAPASVPRLEPPSAPRAEAPAAPRMEPQSAPRAEAPAALRAEAQGGSELDTFRIIIGHLRAKRPELAACLNHAEVVHANSERVVLAFEAGTIFERNASTPEAIALLRAAASEVFGKEPNVVLETRSVNGLKSTIAAVENNERSERKKEALARAKGHPKIALASRILGAKLKEIRLPEE
jgi:hypothetical protein